MPPSLDAPSVAAQNRLLRTIVGLAGLPVPEQLRRALTSAAALLGAEAAVIYRLDGADLSVYAASDGAPVRPGSRAAGAGTPCAAALDADDVAVTEAGVALPVRVGEVAFGALWIDAAPLAAAEADLLRLLASWAGTLVERERQATALRQSEDRLRTVIENTPVVLFALDEDERFTLLAGAGLEALGVTPADRLGERWDARDRDLAPIINGKRTEIRREPSRWRAELGGRWYESQLVAVRDDHGDASGMIGVSFDVTDRERAVREAKATAERLERVLDAAPDAVVLTTPDRRIEYVNPAFERLFGWPSASVVGLPADVCLADPEAGRPADGPALLRYRRADETTFLGETVATDVRDATGAATGTLAFVRDVTEREAAREAAAEAVRAKERFLANMSHEMRTPLNAVHGLSQLLGQTSLSEDQAGLLDGIATSASALLALIDDLLDFARLGAGQLPFEAIPFAPADVAAEVRTILQTAAADKGLVLRLDVAPGVPEAVVGDPTRLRQVLLNLVSNAIKFTEVGSITLALDAVPDGDRARLRVAVSDTGVGIPASRLGAIFDPFTQAADDAARRFGGTGLGLAIVKELVERQGGALTVESEEGVGSTFRVELPVARPAPGEARTPASPAGGPADLSGLRVLLVEDNEMNRFVARRMLQDWGADVLEARDGREAVRAVAETEDDPLDVVLMDLQMPEMDGVAATRYIRHVLGVTSDQLPILALTASVLASQHGDVAAAGLDDFLLKPFDAAVLRARLAHWTGRAPAPEADAGGAAEAALAGVLDGDAALAQQVAGLFVTDGQKTADTLAEAHAAGRLDALARAAHTLKGQAGYVGAVALAATAGRVEDAARAADAVALAAEVPRALRQYAATASELERLYPQPSLGAAAPAAA